MYDDKTMELGIALLYKIDRATEPMKAIEAILVAPKGDDMDSDLWLRVKILLILCVLKSSVNYSEMDKMATLLSCVLGGGKLK